MERLSLPNPSYVSAQQINNSYNPKKFHGYNFDFATTDNRNFLAPTPDTATAATIGTAFYLGDYKTKKVELTTHHQAAPNTGAISLNDSLTSINSRKFMELIPRWF